MRLELPWPPSVNNHWQKSVMRVRDKKLPGKYRHIVHVYLSAEGKAFRTNVQAALLAQYGLHFPRLDGWQRDTIVLYPPEDRRTRDPDNYVKPIHDALAAVGLVVNDKVFARTTNGWEFGDSGEIIKRPNGLAIVTIEPLDVAPVLFDRNGGEA